MTPGAGRHAADDRAGRGEVRRVVGFDPIVKHAHGVAAMLRQVRQVEHQDAAGVVPRRVVEDVGVEAVLDLDPRHIVLGDIVANDDVAGLADIDAGVRGAAHDRLLDQHVRAVHRIEPVGAVVAVGSARPFRAHAVEGDALAVARLDRIACASSTAKSRSVTPLEVTSSPSAPRRWPANESTVRSWPAPRTVTRSTSSERPWVRS